MSGKPAYFITTPIYYVNDAPHIGHAYTTLACDVLARFKRLDGYDVIFLTGTDEHGQKVEKSAQAAGVEPQEFCDRVSQNFRDLATVMKFSNDDFIRTTEERHTISCQALWRRLVEAGDIYLGKYEGWYSIRDEAFYAEAELTKDATGQLSAPSGAPVEWVEEPSYFFRLSAWQDRLLDWYEANPAAIAPASRRNEVLSFVRGGLRDLSVSRTSFKWGIAVPGDSRHIMYVWLDALTNYITALGYPDTESEKFSRYWPADLHIVGKDILRFHTVYWHAFLMSAGLEPPKRVFAHGWWTNEGQKISKSLGNVIDPFELTSEYGIDQVRYFLLREVPFGNDGDFSQQSIINRINGDLSNDLGNLAQRTLTMIQRNCDGAIPTPAAYTEAEHAMIAQADGLMAEVREFMEQQHFHHVLDAIWRLCANANRYFASQEPWNLRKTDPERMGTVLYVTAEVIRHLGLFIQPFMPNAGEVLLTQLSVDAEHRDFTFAGAAGRLTSGRELPPPKAIFPRYYTDK